ncbi:MAG: SDR family NAD(P)-dependent oxidoreductase [Microthrixaceae bacterium]
MISRDDILLTNRRALVTGGARGIGRATAEALAALGARVAICDRLDVEMREAAESISEVARSTGSSGSGGSDEVLTECLDVRDESAVTSLVERISSQWGRLDILVNNAGGGFHAQFMDVSPKGRAALIAENFTQVADVTQKCVPLMSDGGSVVNVTSIEGHRAGPGFGIYSAMKAGVENLTRTLALELADRRIRVNAVAPDMIPTPGDADLAEAASAMDTAEEWAKTPWPDPGTADDVAGAIVFLASPLSSFVTGTTVHVDGGTLAASGWKRRLDDGPWVL